MATSYTDRIDAARNKGGNLYRQVIFATWVAAKDIMQEDPGVQFHAARVVWANKLRFGGIAAAEAFADRVLPQVLLNAGIMAAPETSTDEAVQAVVSNLINFWVDKG